MKKTFFFSLTQAINRYLALDPESKHRLDALQGKVILIELLPIHFSFQCTLTEQGIQIQPVDELKIADTTIRGTPLQFLGVIITKEDRKRFFADDLTLEGDAELGQQIIALFDELEIDWEDTLSHFIGDIPAHQLSRFVSSVKKWLRHSQETISQDINEYIHEEALWLPAREALQEFFTEIDALRMDTDRIDARIKRLESSLIEEAAQ